LVFDHGTPRAHGIRLPAFYPKPVSPNNPYKTMNMITTWNPFRDMEAMQDRILRAMNVSSPRNDAEGKQSLTTTEWTPSVDISEDANGYHIKAELPEVKKEDVHVTVENSVLSIRGERRFEKEETTRKFHRVERSYGSFLRSFSIPDDTDPSGVSAEYKDGVLTILLPKSEEKKPKRIEVSVN
jgi:HSP20 family protein